MGAKRSRDETSMPRANRLVGKHLVVALSSKCVKPQVGEKSKGWNVSTTTSQQRLTHHLLPKCPCNKRALYCKSYVWQVILKLRWVWYIMLNQLLTPRGTISYLKERVTTMPALRSVYNERADCMLCFVIYYTFGALNREYLYSEYLSFRLK